MATVGGCDIAAWCGVSMSHRIVCAPAIKIMSILQRWRWAFGRMAVIARAAQYVNIGKSKYC